jgi:hypothetical protein
VRAQRNVHLIGLVPKDRHCACFPLNDIPDQMSVKKKRETKARSYTPFG